MSIINTIITSCQNLQLNYKAYFIISLQFVQKRDPDRYKEEKDNTVWSMSKLNDYINEKVAPAKGIDKDWVHNILTVSLQLSLRLSLQLISCSFGSCYDQCYQCLSPGDTN